MFRLSMALSDDTPGAGMTALKKVVLTGEKAAILAAEKAIIGATLEFGTVIPAALAGTEPSGEKITLHGRMKVTGDDKSPFSTTTQEWFGVPKEAADFIVSQLSTLAAGVTGVTVS